MSTRGGRWYDSGAPQIHIGDPATMARAQLRIADTCEQALTTLLARTGVTVDQLDFLCVFQGTPWLQPVVYEHLGVRHLEPLDIFQRFAYLSSAMIPAALYVALQAGRLADGKVVAIVGGGTGMTYGATLLRWGA
jgi:3-oxoacyl-[acyl-carrier-protein] synthase-3